jgi:hypothetical protein
MDNTSNLRRISRNIQRNQDGSDKKHLLLILGL